MKRALLLLLALAIVCPGQNVSSSVKGVVMDPSGAVIPGATCSLTNQATSRVLTATSWTDGNFTVPNVLAGRYTLRVRAGGFKALTIRDIVVTGSEVRTLGNLTLQVGDIQEAVSVSAEVAVVSVQLASGERSGLVSGEQLNHIALKGRDFWAMLSTLPGVVDDYSQGRETITLYSNNGTYINGGSATSKNYSVDGVYSLNSSNGSTVVQPNMDSVAEVKVLTSNYQAEYGRMSSGVISVVTRSGSRDFHGSGWAAYRHEMLNARSFFYNRTNTPKSPYRYRIWGYSVSGPAFIPKRFNSDRSKLFFFFSQEFNPITTSYGTQFAATPTAAERNGDFSRSFDVNGALIPVKDPANGQPFPNNTVPASRISKAGQSILNFFPLPNYTDPTPANVYKYNLRSQFSAPTPIRNDVLRLDYNPLPSLSVYYRLLRNTQELRPPWGNWKIGNNYLLTPLENNQRGIGHVVQATKIFSPTLVNEARFGYTLSDLTSDFTDSSLISRSKMGNPAQLYADSGAPDYLPDVSFGGQPANAIRLSLGPGNWFWRGSQYTYTDNISKIWSRHSLKAGFNLDYYPAVGTEARGTWRGLYNFGRDTNNPFDTNHGFANALLGVYQSYTELTKRATRDTVLQVYEEYIQDNWRVTKRLTLDFGLRVVHQPPQYDRNNASAHFDPAYYLAGKSPSMYMPVMSGGKRMGMDPRSAQVVPAAQIGMFVPNSGDPANGSKVEGVDGYPRGLFTRKWIFLAPRFGFAYDLFGTGKTALRGGFGVFYDTPTGNSFESSQGNPPISYVPVTYYGNIDTMTNGTGLLAPSSLDSQAALGRVPLPRTMNFSLGIQHQFRGMVAEASYVGSQVRHLLMTRQLNPIPMYGRFDARNADPTSPGKALSDDFFRQYYGYSSISCYELTGTSNYNSLQTALNRRFTKGLQLGIAYTYSKVLGATGSTPYFSMRKWTYGLMSHDRTNVFVANYMYELPNLGTRTGFKPAHWVLDDWHVSGIVSFVSGAPFTPGFSTTDGQDITGSSEGARITVVGDPYLSKSQRSFARNFNTDAFARTPLLSFGNAGIGMLRGPGVNNWDIALAKRFPLFSEQRHLQFRVEAFNAWNHTQFSGLDTSAKFNLAGAQTNPTFGSFTSARSPRIIQFSARAVF